MGNLDYIEELGIGESQEVETEATEEVNTEEESEEDLSLEPEEQTSEKENPEPSEMDSLRQQIEGMEKRIADKDKYIEELRQASKQKEEESSKQQEVNTPEEEEDFWDNPEKTIKELKNTLKIQQLQIQETHYANTVENYWKTVNPEALREAVATDTDFAQEFNKSREPYKTAYEYLNEKAKKTVEKDMSLREQIRQEVLKELGVKSEKKEVPPVVTGGGKSTSSKPADSEDGFAAVFGADY